MPELGRKQPILSVDVNLGAHLRCGVMPFLPSFAVIIAQADALPPLPSSISHANCFLCRSLIRIAKVSEEGRGGEEKAEEMLAKDACSPLRSLARLNGAKWMEMAKKRAAALIQALLMAADSAGNVEDGSGLVV